MFLLPSHLIVFIAPKSGWREALVSLLPERGEREKPDRGEASARKTPRKPPDSEPAKHST